MSETPHKAASLLLAAARVDPVLRVAAEEVQDALVRYERLREIVESSGRADLLERLDSSHW